MDLPVTHKGRQTRRRLGHAAIVGTSDEPHPSAPSPPRRTQGPAAT